MTMLIFLVALFAFLLMGIPIALGIMLTIAILIEVTGITSFAIIPTYFYAGLNNFSLMAIPFFILAGDLMNEGDLSRGLIEFCRKLLGHIKAGLGYAAVLACMMFACVSGHRHRLQVHGIPCKTDKRTEDPHLEDLRLLPLRLESSP